MLGSDVNNMMKVERDNGKVLLTVNGETKCISQWAEMYGLNAKTLSGRIARGIPEEYIFSQTNVFRKQRTQFNEKYFDVIDNEHKAYWIGFIWCDGYMAIRNRGNRISYEFKLSLQNDDEEHLEKFNYDINGQYEVKHYTYKDHFSGQDMTEARLLITNQYFGKTLVNDYGLIPYRTDCSKILKNIPENLFKHFIRGVVDADGSFSRYQTVERGYNTTKYSVSIGSNQDIVRAIEKHLIDNSIINDFERKIQKRHNENDRDGDYREIRISGKEQSVKLLRYIYDDADIYLDRKYKKYLSVISLQDGEK